MSDLFSEFDQSPAGANPKGEALLGPDGDLEEFDVVNPPAAIAPPHMQEACFVDPNTGLFHPGMHTSFRQAAFHAVPVPLRLKAFYLWLEHGDLVTVASLLSIKVSTVRSLKEKDQWDARAKELSSQLDQTLQAGWKKTKSATLHFALSVLQRVDPARMAGMMDPAGLAAFLKAVAAVGGEPRAGQVVVNTSGPTQVNAGGGPGGGPDLARLSDEELVAEARQAGMTFQPPPPRAGVAGLPPGVGGAGDTGTPPHPLPEAAGGTDPSGAKAA